MDIIQNSIAKFEILLTRRQELLILYISPNKPRHSPIMSPNCVHYFALFCIEKNEKPQKTAYNRLLGAL
ncbi:MAG TPA: hypothetical protein DDY89_09695 [Lysinibacillus sp.]|nr:hypothetical protein [Lysinibacillus sp.]